MNTNVNITQRGQEFHPQYLQMMQISERQNVQ